MVQPEQPQLQRLPLFFRLRTARTANTRIHAKIKMSSTVPIFFPFSESGNHRRMQPAPSTGSRASGLRSGFAAVLTPRCFAPFVAARSTLRGVAGFGAAERLRRCPHPSVLRTLVAARSTLRGVAGFGAAERLRRCPHPSVLRTLVAARSTLRALRASGLRSGFAAVLTPRCFAPFVAARAIGISNHSAFHPCGALNLIAILQICRADLEISPVPAAGPVLATPAWPASTPAPSGRQ